MSSKRPRQTKGVHTNSSPATPGLTFRTTLSAGRAFLLNTVFTLGLVALSQLPQLQPRPVVRASILGIAVLLFAWSAVLFGVVRRGQTVTLDVLLRRQHYLQACLQGSLIVYWGYYWREVYHAVPLILAQLLFAYAFDSLLAWTHRRTWALGFGVFPVIFSITLFFWFKDQWFYFQFVMVALGFTAKEFLRWKRDGQESHIFNPSSFPLAIVSIVLLLAHASDMTWGFLVANTEFYPPHMYLAIFLIGMPGQFLFGVTPMTMSAIVTTYVFSAAYFAATGSYFFFDSHVPIAVFLGMTLLFTDPATAPRTELGRIIYGVLYGLTTVVLYDWLLRAGMPGFYDKLLQVPLLNLSVKWIDAAARSPLLQRLDPSALGRALIPRRRHLAYMTVWAIAFMGMSASGYMGDAHPGQWMPFWQHACSANARGACENLTFLQDGFCQDGSGWACNELGIQHMDVRHDRANASAAFQRACALGFMTGCTNTHSLLTAGALEHSPPRIDDYPFILRGSKGPIPDREPTAIYARACAQGWPGTCHRS